MVNSVILFKGKIDETDFYHWEEI